MDRSHSLEVDKTDTENRVRGRDRLQKRDAKLNKMDMLLISNTINAFAEVSVN